MCVDRVEEMQVSDMVLRTLDMDNRDVVSNEQEKLTHLLCRTQSSPQSTHAE